MWERVKGLWSEKAELRQSESRIDWVLFLATLPIMAAGLVTMRSFTGDNYYFSRQLVWIAVSIGVFFALSFVEFRFLYRTRVIMLLFLASTLSLLGLFVIGHISRGAGSWFRLGSVAFEPSDPATLVMALLLAKYFSRRHIEIANIRHIVVSGVYAFVMFVLILFQPDLGAAIVVFLLWFGTVLFSGIKKRHLALILLTGLAAFSIFWAHGLKQYQKDRILTFVHPLTNISGSGYNAYQSAIAVGSGELVGKGLGYGTQSRLNFLPEYRTDFIFAAFAEEWGFIGVLLLFAMFGIVIWRILANAMHGASNFEILYGVGLSIYFMLHFLINVGMNIGVLPVTGLVFPFMSYGGSHLITEFGGLGILMGMRRYRRPIHKDVTKNEFLGME